MSPELEIFQRVGVDVENVARWLDVTKQAVLKGLEGGHYLTRRRVQTIFSRLFQESPAAAHAFRQELLSIPDLEIPETVFDILTVEAMRDRTLDVGFAYRPRSAQEMWVVSAQPRELQPDSYLERRASELFCKKFEGYRRITPLNRIAYFCPPSVAKDLAAVLRRTFEGIPVDERTDEKVVESTAFIFSAGYTIFDPYQQGQRGWFMVDPGDLYVPMPRLQLSQIATAFRVAGVAGWKPNRALRRSYRDQFIERQAAFEVVEWDVDERNISRVKKKIARDLVELPSDQLDEAIGAIWNPPIFIGGGVAIAGSSAPELTLVFDSLAMNIDDVFGSSE